MREMNAKEVMERIRRDAVSIYSEDSLQKKLESGRKLRIKLGADPSRPDLHLGHSVVLRKLRLLQKLGHEIIFVIGDFTGMIGDPSGRSKTRQPLTFEQTRENGEGGLKQVTGGGEAGKTKITYNSQWLCEMTFSDVIQLAGKYTLARIMERDDFEKRYRENAPIGLHEIFYPLMQGYDSVALHADIEVGGSDQTFNLLVGRELQKDYGQEPQDVLTFPLLPGLDGVEKMSKSLDNYIGIDEASEIMFEKAMKVPDSILEDYFRLTTDLAEEEFQPLLREDIRKAHFLYAEEIVSMYHSKQAAQEAKIRYEKVAAGKVPEQMNTFETSASNNGIIELLKLAGFASSNSEARRLIQGNGIKVDNKPITDVNFLVEGKSEVVLKKGKAGFARIRFQ